VELKEVKLREGYYVMDPEKAVEMVDENTICVAAILGSTLNGEFEDVKLLNDLLTKKNKETGYDLSLSLDITFLHVRYTKFNKNFTILQMGYTNPCGRSKWRIHSTIHIP
jgi:hypothetical protein